MLKGISPAISPELLKVLCEMGHGDEIVLADSNYPGASVARRLLRADGVPIVTLLEGIAPLFPLDTYADPLIMAQPVEGDRLDPAIEADYMKVIRGSDAKVPPPIRLDRFVFYARSREAYAVVMTGEMRTYANIILKKGVIK